MSISDDSLADDLAGGAAGMLPVVGPLVGPIVERMSRAIRREHARNVSVALRAAERLSGLSREDLAEAIEKDPALVPLVHRLLFAAGMTGDDEVLSLLGAALGEAVSDRSRMDEIEMVLGALAELRGHHIKVLALLATPPLPPPDVESEGAIGRWWPTNIEQHLGYTEATVILCMAGLIGAGLVRTLNTMGGDAYELTTLGGALLDVLEEIRSH